jgi:uncharacterized protein with von Willebrand factor type A (vWA) domain
MADARAPLRVVDELLWVLRRSGFAIATSQAIDAARAVRAVGFASRDDVREALAAVIVKRPRDRARFDAAFDAFFAKDKLRTTLWERLGAKGFGDAELGALRELLEAFTAARDGALGGGGGRKGAGEGGSEGGIGSDDAAAGAALSALVHRGAELDRLLQLAETTRTLEGMQGPQQIGFFTYRLLEQVGTWRASSALDLLRSRLADALGPDAADALVAALREELKLAGDDVRAHVREIVLRREAHAAARGDDLLGAPLATLDDAEIEEVRRAVRGFVARLRGGERVRRRAGAKRGRIDAHRTLRRAMRSGGVPFQLARRARRRDKPRLVVLCDVSDSVRSVSRFLLELTHAAQDLFAGTRSFVFVSELGEATRLFAEEPVALALQKAYSGGVVPVTHNSNYGRVLSAFAERVLGDVDRRTTVVVLGDGRTNYQADAAEVLDRIRERARALVWLCPEPRAAWASGDSAMARYAPKCTKVLEVRCARDLEDATRLLASLR